MHRRLFRRVGNQMVGGPLSRAMEFRDLKAGERRKGKPGANSAERRERSLLAISDPQPVAEVSRLWRTAAQSATIGMFVILLVVALSLARPVLLPVVSAFVVTMMLGPLSARAERYRIPSLISAIILWLLVIGVFYGVIVLLAVPVVDWVGKAPDIGRTIEEKLHVFDRPIALLQDLRDALLPADKKGSLGVDIMTFLQPVVLVVTPALGQLLIFFGTLFFMLLGRARMRRVLVAFFAERDARLRMLKIMNDIEHNLTGYLSIVTIINVAIGLCGGFAAWVTGLPDPVAWAVLGFHPQFYSLHRCANNGGRSVFGRSCDVYNSLACFDCAVALLGACHLGRTLYYTEHYGAQIDAQSAHRIPGAGFLDLVVGAGRGVFGRTAVDCGAGRDRSSLSRGRARTAVLAYWRGGRGRARHGHCHSMSPHGI